jgi:prefoldin subunit 5
MYNYNAEENLKEAIEKYPDLKEKIQNKIQETCLHLDKADRVANKFKFVVSQIRTVQRSPPVFLDDRDAIIEQEFVHKRH